MGTIEETRKLVQDFLASELREIKARIESLEGTTRTRFDAVHVQFDGVQVQFAGLEARINSRFDAVDKVIATQNAMIAAQHAAVMHAIANPANYVALAAERLSKLESERREQAH